jgi:hypothetical protein
LYSFIYIYPLLEEIEREREKRENTSVCLIIILLTVIADHKDMGVENVAVYLPPEIFNDQVEERERENGTIDTWVPSTTNNLTNGHHRHRRRRSHI